MRYRRPNKRRPHSLYVLRNPIYYGIHSTDKQKEGQAFSLAPLILNRLGVAFQLTKREHFKTIINPWAGHIIGFGHADQLLV